MSDVFEHFNNISRQTFDAAIITNSKGKKVGKILVRYTNAQIGWNNETGIYFYGHGDNRLEFSSTIKGNTYTNDSVYVLLKNIGAKVYGFNDVRFYSYGEEPKTENRQSVDSISRCTEFLSFKLGNSKFNILWI